MDNMELFNEYTAKILAQLYESFPLVSMVDAGRLSGCKPDDYGEIAEKGRICAATIEWLRDAGYIGCEPRMEWIYPARLTVKGLETLKVCPAALDTRQNAGEALTDAVKKGSLEVAVRLAAAALTEGFRVLTKI